MGIPEDSRRACRREVWVVLPDRSRPSMTMNGARLVIVMEQLRETEFGLRLLVICFVFVKARTQEGECV